MNRNSMANLKNFTQMAKLFCGKFLVNYVL